MILKIDNRDLSYTIDTYGTFTLDSAEEYIKEGLFEDDSTLTYENLEDRFEFTYDMDAWILALANESIAILRDNLIGDIVKNITFDKTRSPSFYNYTTDSYTASWDYDEEKLKAYVLDDFAKFKEFVTDNWSSLNYDLNWNDKKFIGTIGSPVNIDMFLNDDVQAAMLDFYTQKQYNSDVYFEEMYDHTNEAAHECIDYKEINSIRSQDDE